MDLNNPETSKLLTLLQLSAITSTIELYAQGFE